MTLTVVPAHMIFGHVLELKKLRSVNGTHKSRAMMYVLASKRSVRRAEPHGFTLIELLVVVAIIALLVAILLPSLNAARGHAERIVCASNTRQFAMAFYYYCNDNDGQMPELTHSSTAGDWFVELVKYIGESSENQDVWDCPSDEHKEENLMGYAPNFANVLAYWVDLSTSHGGPYPWPIARLPFNVNSLRRPGEVMSFTETWGPGQAVLTPYGPTSLATWPLDEDFDGDGVLDSNATERINGENWWGWPAPYNRVAARHGDRVANAGFMDGHVESLFINDMLADRVLWAVELVGMPDK